MHEPILDGEPLVDVVRGDVVESVHRVAACACDDRGTILLAAGTIDEPVFLRSTAKPFIAAAVIAAGARERFGLTAEEIAVMAASHAGERFHVASVRSILQKIGLPESALQCGVHPPYDDDAARALREAGEEPTAVHNNCSGKHAGILALSSIMGADPSGYLRPDHPAQRAILAFCARVTGDDPLRWPVAVDGCGIPVFATSLRRAATGFARWASLRGLSDRDAAALAAVRDAMVAHPEYVAGTKEFDTALMRVGRGAIACKAGAEGVHGVAAIERGLGYASKVVDGASRGRAPVTVAALRALGVLSDAQERELAGFARPVVYNRAGRAVGEIRARPLAVATAGST